MIRELSTLINEHANFPLWGILLFTEAHPHVIKTLKDEDYFSALNEITGDNLALFATMLFVGKYEVPSLPPGMVALLRPVWKEPQQNKKVLPWFNIEDSRKLPLLVVFGNEGGKLYYQIHPIKDDSPQDVFNSLEGVLSRISEVVDKTCDENGVDKKKIFKQAQWEMKKLEAQQKIKDFFETVSLFRGAIGV